MSDRITQRHQDFARALARICAEHNVLNCTAQIIIKNEQLDNDYIGVSYETTVGFHPKVTIGHGANMVLDVRDLTEQKKPTTTVVNFPGTV